jgi:nucleotide sugar dehydrogenase
MNVVVVGAGKMGLPLACQLAQGGARVTACDVDRARVDAINAGRCPIDEPGVPEMLAAMVAAGRLRASTDTAAAVAGAEAIVVIVPALLTPAFDIDPSVLVAASAEIARTLERGALVSYETTLPVGGTRRILQPVLERGGLKAGADFDLVFSPERVKSQRVLQNLTVNVKVVGGITPAAAERATAFYRTYLGAPVQNVGSLEAAEMVKLAGMVYRDVTIALANELGRYAAAVGVDLPALLPAINSDGEAALLEPGIGVGGHCTPVYPYFLIRDAERRGLPAALPALGRRTNDGQAAWALDALERTWEPLAGKRALILGLAFRPGVKEHVCSTAFLLRDELARRGATPLLHDPLYAEAELAAHGFAAGALDTAPVPEVLILNTAHAAYRTLAFGILQARGLRAVIDGRNFFDPEAVRRAGLHYVGIGRPLPPAETAPPLAIARPLLGASEAEAAAAVVRTGWVLQGPQVAAFEREFAAFTGAPHACAVSSGTAALHLALLAAGVGPGDEVVTVSHSYIATANAVRYCGATPVFVDVEPGTFNIDPRRVEAALTARTRAILCVHQMGMPCDLAALAALARARGLRLIEDAACAAGSEIEWAGRFERIGKPHGDAACFSFHPRKVITTGDGGMLTTADPEWDRLFRLWRQHGMTVGAADRAGARALTEERFAVLGYNYRLTDIQGAVGREQLRRLPELVAKRRAVAAWYRAALAAIPGLGLPIEPAFARSNWQSYCVRLPPGTVRAAVMQALLDRGIATRPGIMNAHQEPPYAEWAGGPLPESERARAECLMLPLHDGMTDDDVHRVAEALAAACAAR